MTSERSSGGGRRRNADARDEVTQFEQESTATVIRSERTGAILDPSVVTGLRDPNTGKVKAYSAPKLTAQEQAQMAAALKQGLEQNQLRYPMMAQAMINDPSKLWLMAEVQMMLDPQPNEAAVNYTGELMEALTVSTGARQRYEHETSHGKTQQIFWQDVASHYTGDERKLFLDSLAQLNPKGADRVAALAIAWADNHDMTDPENQQQLVLNTFNWAYSEEQSELGAEGFWGGLGEVLDSPQEFVEENIVAPLVNAGVSLVSGAEEAARRKGLTPGQQLAYTFGLRPPDEAGDWGWWRLVSGTFDAQVELGADPLNVIAGIGAGAKAAQLVPVAAKATRAGRAAMAARALLPRSFGMAGQAGVRGGRIARLTYALTAKNLDDLMEQTVKNGVAGQALDMIKSNNPARFERLFPGWSHMPDEMWRVIQEHVETPEEFVQVLKAGAVNEVINSGRTVDDLTKASDEAWEAVNRYVDSSHGPIWSEIAQNPDDFVRHADATGSELKGGVNKGGFSTLAQKFDEETLHHATKKGKTGVVHYFRKADLPPFLQKQLDETGQATAIDAIPPGARPKPVASHVADAPRPGPMSRADLLADNAIPRDVRLNAAKNQLALDAFNATPGRAFVISDVPQRSKSFFSWDKVLTTSKGTGRAAQGVRRTVARMTPGRPDDVIDLFNDRKGSVQLQKLFEHFGMRQSKIDELVNEFRELDLGARQDWIWDRGLRELGAEIGVPAFEHNLIQFYKNSGIRKFSGSQADTWIDLGGQSHKMPLLPSQFSREMPIPLDDLSAVFRRSKSIGNRSKAARAMGWNGRGINATVRKGAESSYKNRKGIVDRLRTQLGDEAGDMSDDELWHMAYSMISPDQGMDARGWIAGTMMPKAGSVFNSFHRTFTKFMLVFRPVQWMWRVALLEEPIRAHIYNMPSLYSNPLQYMSAAREAHYVSRLTGWAEANAAWGQDIYNVLTKGAGKDELLKRLDDMDLLGEIPDATRLSLPQLRKATSSLIRDATYGRTRVTKLNPVKRVPWAVRNRATNISRAEKALQRHGMPTDFDFIRDAEEINGVLMRGYLGEAVGAADRKLYQWDTAMTDSESFTHGQVWGANLIKFTEDSFGNIGLQYRASQLRGDDFDAVSALINSSKWDLMRHDLGLRFPDAVDDVALAERYLDDMLVPEIDHLFKPFVNQLDDAELADLFDDFASGHRIKANISGQEIDWDLRGQNYGGGVRQVGDFVAANKNRPDIEIPSNLPAPSMDARFMAHDDKNFINRTADWVLQTFGEKATQELNRRPAFMREYKRWYDNYINIGVPEATAQRLARDNAARMVNYVFFDMEEAPYYAAKLNQYIPFFGATYEVLSTWSYKMPVAVGGSWPVGVGEFSRKFDRLMDAFVNTGLVTREKNDEGDVTYTLNLVPPDSEAASNNELGRMLQGAGFKAVNTLDQVISTILGLEEGLELRSQGYRLAVGHPLNPEDYGILSFAQAQVGLNPLANIMVSNLAAVIPGATGPERTVAAPGETLADVVDRTDIDINEIIRYNREVFVDTKGFGSSELYNSLLAGQVDPTTLTLPEGAILNLPGSSLFDAFSDVFMPFGEIHNPQEFAMNYLPGSLRWALAGLALQNQPTDEFWKSGELTGVFGGLLPSINEAQVSSQLNEVFMYLEAHDLVDGKGPFARIQEKEQRLTRLLDEGLTEQANALRSELQLDTEAFLSRAQKVAAESLILRSLTGQMMPTSPGHVRLEQETIRNYWDSREYADSIKAGEGAKPRLNNFKSMEDVENYYEQLAAWLSDPTGDRARAVFQKNNPQLMAYLTPKTFYKEPVPDINSYEEYQKQIESGQRQPAPLHVTMWRARSSSIQADYYNKYIATFGNDPKQAAANALWNREEFRALQDEKDRAYAGLEMWDDMHGNVYSEWRKENYEDTETWAQDQINDKLNKVRDNLQILFELEDSIEVDLDLDGVANLNGAIRGSIAEISKAIREYNELMDNQPNRNAYEDAINQYFEEVYIPYSEQLSELYDQLPEVADSERQSLIYEQIKFFKNQFAGSDVYLNDDFEMPFPNPLEYSWQGKPEEERTAKLQQWLTRPLEWIDQDQAIRIVESAPHMQKYLPTTDAEFTVYREYTLAKINVDEMFEANEITRSQRNKMMDKLEEQLWTHLIQTGRSNEVELMHMTPFEKLELSGQLPQQLGIFSDNVRYYKETLKAHEETAGTIKGRQITAPLYDSVEEAFFRDPTMRSTLQQLGVNLQDDDTLDTFLPWLFFGYTGER